MAQQNRFIGAGAYLTFLSGLLVAPLAGQPVIYDWTEKHTVFSDPGTMANAMKNGRLNHWMRIQNDVRYRMQNLKRNGRPSEAAIAAAGKKPPPTTSGLLRDWSMTLGASGSTVGSGNFPAKYSFDISSAKCDSATTPDFVVYPTSLNGSATQATLIAYDNLYSGCTGSKPLVYWQYNIANNLGNGAKSAGSPVLSADGSQVAFLATGGSLTGLNLIILKWFKNASLISPSITLASNYRSCTPTASAPCWTAIPLSGSSASTNSSPYYDYDTDTLYVGGDSGKLHKVQNVFVGSNPAEVTSGWPISMGSGKLTSPVLDRGTNSVIAASSDGIIYWVSSAGGPVTASSTLATGLGFVATPIVDSSAGFIYAFAGSNGNPGNAQVTRIATGFTSNASGTSASIGTGSLTRVVQSGTFDNAYYSASTPTGNLYVCGSPNTTPSLYRIPVSSTGFGSPLSWTTTLASASQACSPITEIQNGSTDRIFVGVTGNGTPSGCASGGCIMSVRVNGWAPSTAYSVGQVILDTNWNYQAVTTGGTSGATAPSSWSSTVPVGNTSDGTVTWRYVGKAAFVTTTWTSNTVKAVNDQIVDSNGNVQTVISTTSSGRTTNGAAPPWASIPGTTTSDNNVTWICQGASQNPGLPAANGTSGIIIDNTVPSGTLSGASQVYYSTLGTQTCIGNGTTGSGANGGCAVQASQSGLQ